MKIIQSYPMRDLKIQELCPSYLDQEDYQKLERSSTDVATWFLLNSSSTTHPAYFLKIMALAYPEWSFGLEFKDNQNEIVEAKKEKQEIMHLFHILEKDFYE